MDPARALVLEAVKQNGVSLDCAYVDVKRDRAFVFGAVIQDYKCLAYAPKDMQHGRAIVLEAVMQDGGCLAYAHAELKRDRTIMLVTVNRNGWWLTYAHEDLRCAGPSGWRPSSTGQARCGCARGRATHRAFMLRPSIDGRCIAYAHEGLERDRAFVLGAIKWDGGCLATRTST